MTQNKIVQIILGAGCPFRGDRNASLIKTSSNTRVLDWTLQATKFLNPEVHFVAGYQIDEIVSRYPDLHYTINSKWNSTGPITSLLESQVSSEFECIVSYNDILFHEEIVKKLVDLDADVGIVVDSTWKERYLNRTLEDINRSEKVIVYGDQLIESGGSISADTANAEFIGLLFLKPKVMRFLQKNVKSLPASMYQANLTSLLEHLQQHGFNIKTVDVKGDWAELNDMHDMANFILGTKAQSLKRLEEVVTLSKIAPQVSFTVSEWTKNYEKIVNNIQLKFGSKNVIVRSSAISEDGFDSSNAGAYLSILNVDASIKKTILNVVTSVIDSYIDGNQYNQVLVQSMVENVSVSGVIFTRTLSESAPYYVINFDDLSQKTDTITSGSSNNHKTLVISRSNVINWDNSIPRSIHGLIPAIQEIENILNFQALDIEFAIGLDGTVYIFQVRPLTSNKYEIDTDHVIFKAIESSVEKFKSLQNNTPFVVGKSTIFGVMPDWNPAEIIGTKPYPLSFDLYRYLITDEVWATQRAEYGYRDVRPQPLLVSFSGHPYIDVRASFNSFIPASLDNDLAGRLVDFYLMRLCENHHYHDKVEFKIVPTCYAFDFQNWREVLNKGGFSNDEIDELQLGLQGITMNAISRTPEDLKTIEFFRERFDGIFYSDLPLLDKALSLLEDCRRYGTLVFAHLARSAFVGVTLLKSAVETKVISQGAMDSFLNSIETVAHEFTNDAARVAQQEITWNEFVNRYGHLRPGTYDITSESYSNNVEKFLKPAVEHATDINKKESINDNTWLNEKQNFSDAITRIGITANIDTVEKFLRNAIEGREYAKFIFSRNLSFALECIVDYGKEFGLDRENLAHLSLGSLFKLRSGSMTIDDITTWLLSESGISMKTHKKNIKIELPPLITKDSDFYTFLYLNSDPNYVGTGRIVAECVTIGATDLDQDQSYLTGKILLIPQADPGFDWIFGYNVAGLITMYGGGNSHMAIRANEFGLPAAIGVGENKYSILAQSTIIELDVSNRRIQVLQ